MTSVLRAIDRVGPRFRVAGQLRNSINHGPAIPQKAERPESYQDGDNYSDPEKSLLAFGDLLHICLRLAPQHRTFRCRLAFEMLHGRDPSVHYFSAVAQFQDHRERRGRARAYRASQ